MIGKELDEFVTRVEERMGLTYDGGPYRDHRVDVKWVLIEFGFPSSLYPSLHEAADMHDLFEDTGIKPAFMRALGVDAYALHIAECVTDEPGETREEKKAKTYPKIRGELCATRLKLADRIANWRRSIKTGHRHALTYSREYPEFKAALKSPACKCDKIPKMWEELDRLAALRSTGLNISEG